MGKTWQKFSGLYTPLPGVKGILYEQYLSKCLLLSDIFEAIKLIIKTLIKNNKIKNQMDWNIWEM